MKKIRRVFRGKCFLSCFLIKNSVSSFTKEKTEIMKVYSEFPCSYCGYFYFQPTSSEWKYGEGCWGRCLKCEHLNWIKPISSMKTWSSFKITSLPKINLHVEWVKKIFDCKDYKVLPVFPEDLKVKSVEEVEKMIERIQDKRILPLRLVLKKENQENSNEETVLVYLLPSEKCPRCGFIGWNFIWGKEELFLGECCKCKSRKKIRVPEEKRKYELIDSNKISLEVIIETLSKTPLHEIIIPPFPWVGWSEEGNYYAISLCPNCKSLVIAEGFDLRFWKFLCYICGKRFKTEVIIEKPVKVFENNKKQETDRNK